MSEFTPVAASIGGLPIAVLAQPKRALVVVFASLVVTVGIYVLTRGRTTLPGT